MTSDKEDTARKAYKVGMLIRTMQNSFTAISKCKVPVIAVINGYCIGGAVDLVSACDILICTQDSKWSIREVKIGMAADLGSLARLPSITKNWSLLNELAFTGRFFGVDEVRELALTNFICKDQNEAMVLAKKMAVEISENSPVAVSGIKKAIGYVNRLNAQKSLDFIRLHNQSALMTDDMASAVQSIMSKSSTKFQKL